MPVSGYSKLKSYFFNKYIHNNILVNALTPERKKMGFKKTFLKKDQLHRKTPNCLSDTLSNNCAIVSNRHWRETKEIILIIIVPFNNAKNVVYFLTNYIESLWFFSNISEWCFENEWLCTKTYFQSYIRKQLAAIHKPNADAQKNSPQKDLKGMCINVLNGEEEISPYTYFPTSSSV